MKLQQPSCIKLISILAFIVCNAIGGFAQGSWFLSIHDNKEYSKPISDLSYEQQFNEKLLINQELLRLRLSLYDQGYIAARFDSVVERSDTVLAYLTIGQKYEMASLEKGDLDEEVWKQLVSRKDVVSFEVFKYYEIKKLFENIISHYENRGYPFVSIGFDSVTFDSSLMSAKLKLEKGEMVVIDSIIIKGDSKVRNGYLYNYLGIKPGDPYNESAVREISKRIEEIAFLQEKKAFEIAFTDNGAWIYLYLEKKKASRFDGILGIMPNNEESGKILLTGDVSLLLHNAFRWGELISFNWRKLEQNTQDLKFKLMYPFIFSTPFVIDYDFALLKKDTLYYTLNNILGLQYQFTGNNYLKIFINYWNSNLISTSGLENATSLPNYADIKTRLYGVGYHLSKLDYLYNPIRGFHIEITGSAGNKTIDENKNLDPELYNDLNLKSVLYNVVGDLGAFIPLARKSTIWLRSQSAFLNNDDLFENELYRIGGMRILRGFDEESIYASLYSVFTVEFRYLFERNSFFNVFWNGGYYEKNTRDAFVSDSPYGFGAGINFETKAGIFSLNYALGKQFDNPIDLKSAKIHFGILSRF